MRTLSMKIPAALDARLQSLARQKGATKSAVLREIIDYHFSRGAGRPPGKLLALAADLLGCIEGSPDLSSNPRHMRGYGR